MFWFTMNRVNAAGQTALKNILLLLKAVGDLSLPFLEGQVLPCEHHEVDFPYQQSRDCNSAFSR